MIELRILRQAHEALALKLMGEQARLGRGLSGHQFWRDRQSEAFALPSFAVDSIQDASLNFILVTDSSGLDGDPIK